MREYVEGALPGLDVDAIRKIVDEAPVRGAIIFGSHARGSDRPSSDVDVAVEFDPGLESTERTRVRLRLIEQLSTTLGTDAIDVVPLESAAGSLRRAILEDGVLVYGSPPAQVESHSVGDQGDRRPTADRFDDLLADLERTV